ncbi:proto-oncogene tyrosine-protein kinase receptor Ret-like [Asterias rubens]|uniref:proto-oncogene tyrosine-protein kinase receptor Ret-like n=1 Tax=Asterias rubens TaxID=7604 RepID=UPI001455B32A|nr:proto-oncogene tyrosine-protein kinase receptor Ret-like [Asterias rubens]
MGYLTANVLGYFLLLLLAPRMTGSEGSSFYFTMDSYSIKIPSDLRVNEPIAQIYTRPFTNTNSSYVLRVAVDDQSIALSREAEELFAIDQETGQIYLQQQVDSKGNLTGWNFTLQISAWSQRERPRGVAAGEARMTVGVTDGLPRCTCFDSTRYVFRLRPDSELGAFGTLRSLSSCLNANSASFTYAFLTENFGDWLYIDNHTSELFLIRHPTSSQDGRNTINVVCTMENAEGGGSNQTLSQTAEVLLNLEAVPDYDVNIRENRSRGDHVAWIRSNNSDAIRWQTIAVTMAGKHNDTYGVNTVSPMATTVSSGGRVIGEIILLRMLPCNMVDKHTITLQLKEGNDTTSKGDSTREKEVVTVIIDVDIHASLEHRVVINTSLHRGAAQYTRITTLQLPPCISLSTSLSEFINGQNSLPKFLQVDKTSGIVYLNDVTPLKNLSLTSYIKEIKKFANIEEDLFITEWEINIEIIGGLANCTLDYNGCSSHMSEEGCTSHCGYGSPDGVCKWRQQESPFLRSYDFSTCSPDFGTCPNRECDGLERSFPLLCPQDCIETVDGGNLLFMVTLNHNGLGIAQAIGPCWCDLYPDCYCVGIYNESPTSRVENVTDQVQSIDTSNTVHRATTTETARTTRQVFYNYKPDRSSVLNIDEDQCTNCVFIIMFCILVLFMVVVVVIIYTWRGRASPLRRILSGRNYKPPVIIDGSDSRLTSVLSECSDDGVHHVNKCSVIRLKTEFDPKWEFSRRNLILDKVLGEGEFGRVVRAQALSLRGHTGYTTVAVKMLKGSYTSDDLQDLITEMNLLKELNHPNVVKLLGASTQKGPLYVIVEYCQYGCLRDFLRQNRPNPTYQDDDCSLNYCKEDGNDVVLNNRDLLSFAWQICKGMQYLAMLKLVHRDLAARNILVTDGLVIKVSDFGLARDTYENGAYIKTSKSRIPMKWMAPESLFDNIYTSKTDIWSFGVLFWEIVTMGAMPYPGMMSHKLCQMLREGYRLERPDGCADELYTIMQKCWQSDPNNRPDFDTVGVMLESIMEINADYLDLSCEPFGDCLDKELAKGAPNDDKTSSAVPLLQIPTPESTELMPLMKERLEKPYEKELKEIIVEETDVDSGPLYGDIDSCQLYNNLNFLTDHLCKTVSEPNLGPTRTFQE